MYPQQGSGTASAERGGITQKAQNVATGLWLRSLVLVLGAGINQRIWELLSFVIKMEQGEFCRAEIYVKSVAPTASFTHTSAKHMFSSIFFFFYFPLSLYSSLTQPAPWQCRGAGKASTHIQVA